MCQKFRHPQVNLCTGQFGIQGALQRQTDTSHHGGALQWRRPDKNTQQEKRFCS
jgi:hypothetical protein